MLGATRCSTRGLANDDARLDHVERIKDSVAARRDALLELELMLGIESPADLQPQRLAVQVKQPARSIQANGVGCGQRAADPDRLVRAAGRGRRTRPATLRQDRGET